MKIVIIIMTLYLWYGCIRETISIERDMQKGIYVDNSKNHSLQHIAVLLGAVLVTIFEFYMGDSYFCLFAFNIYILLIVLPHIVNERTDDKY